ncbi:MAG TPA: hypothetical protein PKD05_24710, partial [Candidatus Melainabacteria bacterium]|nr:hypothetical protein [Candidatus Melainabacteria bacterium]
CRIQGFEPWLHTEWQVERKVENGGDVACLFPGDTLTGGSGSRDRYRRCRKLFFQLLDQGIGRVEFAYRNGMNPNATFVFRATLFYFPWHEAQLFEDACSRFLAQQKHWSYKDQRYRQTDLIDEGQNPLHSIEKASIL